MQRTVNLSRWIFAAAVFIVLVAVGRVALSYSHTAQAFDEPYHIAAGVEFVDRGSYTVDPLHPPLQRIAVGLSLKLAGVHFPSLSSSSGSFYLGAPPACALGNEILNESGRYWRNLTLARLGVLPFLLLGSVVVFLWTRQEYGEFAAVTALAMFTTIPIVLAFSSIAYTDIVAAATQAAACWGIARWLEKETWRSTVWMGAAAGFAFSAKTTTVIFLPACALGMWLLRYLSHDEGKRRILPSRAAIMQVITSGIIAVAILWGAYGFAFEHLQEGMQLSATSMPTLQNFPAPVRRIGLSLIRANPRIPAPALLKGMASVWVMEKEHPVSYLFGQVKHGGWWYFFPVGVAVKTPIPFLILCVIGWIPGKRLYSEGRWTALAPIACVLAILLATMPVKINYGMRHVLAVFPLLAMVTGAGCAYLWNLPARGRIFGRAAAILLLISQCVSSAQSSKDYIGYFNSMAGNDPSHVLVAGCDLDCGQDLFLLSQELQARHVAHVSLALWTSADIREAGLPEFEIAAPSQPVHGWFAISLRALRMGDLFHTTYPPGAFDWLSRYQPVVKVGKTILLYHIPEQ